MSSIRPIDMNGMISKSSDVNTLKQNDHTKNITDQSNYQNHFEKEVTHQLKQVNDPDTEDSTNFKKDAREKGSNEYEENKKKREKQEDKTNGADKVIVKGQKGFDVKI